MFDRLNQKSYRIISSKYFLYASLVLFALSAVWVATASIYPMAFDEEFHIGIIKMYAGHILPILTPTPVMAKYGGVYSDPSYLYHYLMSFPWLLERNVFHMSEAASIIGLRFLNVGLFTAGLVIFWRTLRLAGFSAFARNLVIAFCCLIPISPILAAQVNYDNLLILLSAVSFLFATRLVISLKEHKRLPVRDAVWLAVVLLLGSATKYAFLPIAVAMFGFFAVMILLPKYRKPVFTKLAKDMRALSLPLKLLLIALVLLGAALNVRYVYNLTAHHSVAPKCDQFYTTQQCLDYGPFGRNEKLRNNLDPNFEPKNIAAYFVEDWIPGMTFRLFFAVAGPTNDYDTKPPVFTPIVLYCTVVFAGVVLFLARLRKVLRHNQIAWLFFAVVGFYSLTLLMSLYGGYRSTGAAVALNGRYLLPIAPIIGALAAMAFQTRQKVSKNYRQYKGFVAAVVLILLFVEGGGIGTYIVRGESEWFLPGWGQSSYQAARDVLDPITLKVLD